MKCIEYVISNQLDKKVGNEIFYFLKLMLKLRFDTEEKGVTEEDYIFLQGENHVVTNDELLDYMQSAWSKLSIHVMELNHSYIDRDTQELKVNKGTMITELVKSDFFLEDYVNSDFFFNRNRI